MRAPTRIHLFSYVRVHQRRGVAMLLVILSLTFATIVSVAYLASRDNADLIGANVADAAEARWAAESGLAVGLSVLQTQSNWRTEHTAGLLYDNLVFGNATVSITLTDLKTGAPPVANTEYVQMIVHADQNGLERTAIARVYVRPPSDGSYDADLSEFAVFAIDTLDVRDQSTLAAWETAPNTGVSSQVNVGTSATNASSIHMGLDAAPLRVNIFNGPGASTFLISNSSAFDVVTVGLTDNMVVPAPPDHGQPIPGGSTIIPLPIVLNAATQTISMSTRYSVGKLLNNATLDVNDGVILIIDGDLTLTANSRLRIGGDVQLIVFGNLTISDSAFEIANAARLRTWVRGDVTLDHAFLGEENAAVANFNLAVHQYNETAPYFAPPRLKLYGIDPATYIPGPIAPMWSFNNNSVLKGIGYSPYADASINAQSAIYGRILANQITLTADAGLYFDSTLNDNRGYTSTRNNLFQGNGSVRPEVASYTQLTDFDGVSHTQAIVAPIGPVPVDILEVILPEEALRLTIAPGPTPADPVVIEADTRAALTTWSSFSIASDYSDTSLTTAMAQKVAIETEFQAAADAIAIADYATARANLQSILDRNDGDPAVPDYLRNSLSKTALFNEVTRIMGGLNTLP